MNDGQEMQCSQTESAEDAFERELLWCIEQLQLGLETQRPNSKQAMEAVKILRILQSDKTSMIKKRQAMRNTFGDYRQKMKTAEKKAAAKMRKLEVASGQSTSSSSVFYRKRSRTAADTSSLPASTQSDAGGTSSVMENGGIVSSACGNTVQSISQTSDRENEGLGSREQDDLGLKLQQTVQEFRFNFNISEDDAVVKSNSDSIDVVKSDSESVVSKGEEDGADSVKSYVDGNIHSYFVDGQKEAAGFKFNFPVT